MQRMKLHLDDLTVESFHPTPRGAEELRGTVHGHGKETPGCTGQEWTCDTVMVTCEHTCDPNCTDPLNTGHATCGQHTCGEPCPY